MRKTMAIVRATLIECMRGRIFLVALLFMIFLFVLSVALANIALGQRVRIVSDIAATAASLLGSIIAIAMITTSMAADIRHRTMHTVLVRPISRSLYLVARALGFWCVMIVLTSLMLFSAMGIVLSLGHAPPLALVATLPLVWSEMAVVVGLSVLFNTLSKPALAVSMTTATLMAAHASGQLFHTMEKLRASSPVLSRALRMLYFALPHMDALSLRVHVANRLAIPNHAIAMGLAHGLCYAALTIAFASLIFRTQRL